ncbi:hypothetical protein QAD02_018320 [Eretmocerus hayati]|uniref:Uncharacterized protein n=1 Tax=Eretmocerus hayati TaxID=131215 RepID=A0ACC2PHK9_9HYME|nr:hypothetical protein QAD02_018320 [Eretmocerus hayati]
MKIFLLSVLPLMDMVIGSMNNEGNTPVDDLLSCIRSNPSPYKINLIVGSFKNLSSLATGIIQRTNQEFVCNNVGYKSMSKMKSINVTSDEFESYAAQRINERNTYEKDLRYDDRYLKHDTSLLVDRKVPPEVGATVSRDFHKQYLTVVHIPSPVRMHFYLLRWKNYERGISWTAILAFAGLCFTASIFAVWAYLLGFNEQNWTFLNILTAQMGGSIEIRGRMRLSKMIYQMSIYVATFIVVTLGADYMMEIFILHQYLPPIETIQDLADANIDLSMTIDDHEDWVDGFIRHSIGEVGSSPSLQRIFNRTRKVHSKTFSFCYEKNGDISDLQMSPNLCYSWSDERTILEISTSEFQIDKIREPIISRLAFLCLDEKFFLKSRLEEVINKLSGAGMFENWKRNVSHLGKLRNRLNILNFERDKQVPLQEQLWPVLAVGFTLGIIALICEFIWKLWIGKTELGRLVRAFYSRSRSNSAGRRSNFQENMRSSRPSLNIHTSINLLPVRRKNHPTHLRYRPVQSAPI